jgi:2-phospho-L-lactate/phosphoenolpyruvate guanylyltransferase
VSTVAILPIKTLDDAKQRLAQELDPRPRRALVEAMFSDVLVALRRATLVDQVLVVSKDHNAQRIAGGYGATVCDDEDTGHNDAATRGIERALELGADRVLLVPGDCPMLDPGELDDLLRRPVEPPSVLIVPDRHGTGTNALLLDPPDAMKPSFGPGSHDRHTRHASAAGITALTVELPSLALDLDTPEDLQAVEATSRT